MGIDIDCTATEAKKWLESVRTRLKEALPGLPSREVKHGRKAPVDQYLTYWNPAGGRLTLAVRARNKEPGVFVSEVKQRRGADVERRYEFSQASDAVDDYLARLRSQTRLFGTPGGK